MPIATVAEPISGRSTEPRPSPRRRLSPAHGAALCTLAGLVAIFAGSIPAHADTVCRPGHPPIVTLDLKRYYTDTAGTAVDERKRAAKRAAVAPLKAFMVRLAEAADRAKMRLAADTPRSHATRCLLDDLTAWARAGALLGDMPGKQAQYERNWALAGIATSYVKLRPFATVNQRHRIDAWLVRLADKSKAFLDEPGRKRNNHQYWLGLGLASTGLATGSDRHWTAARAIMREAAESIEADGTLPLELARGRRALHYHNFAAQPLFVMALLARARNEDWAAMNDGALHRLVRLLDTSTTRRQPPQLFVRETGVAQEPIKPKDFEDGWHLDYLRQKSAPPGLSGHREPANSRSTRPRSSNYHRLGGRLDTLLQALHIYRR